MAVNDYRLSRDWYIVNLGMKLEFEVRKRNVAAVQDDSGLTLVLQKASGKAKADCCILAFEVGNVEAKHREFSAKGVPFVHGPMKKVWGYGAELKDPSGYRIYLWDEKTMREKG